MTFKTDFLFSDYNRLCWILIMKTVILLVLFVSAAFAFTMYSRLGNNIYYTILLGLGVFVLLLLLERGFVFWRARSVFKRSPHSEELILTLGESGITQMADSGETKLAWEDIYRVLEDKACYYVFIDKSTAFYFPKRSFNSPEHKKQFIDMMINKVSAKKLFLSFK